MHSPPTTPTSRLLPPAIATLSVVLSGIGVSECLNLAALPQSDHFNHRAAQAHLNEALPRCLREAAPRSATLKAAISSAIAHLETRAHRGNYLTIALGLGEQLGRELLLFGAPSTQCRWRTES